jgi:tetratricopeptide (TPR) repeat protein
MIKDEENQGVLGSSTDMYSNDYVVDFILSERINEDTVSFEGLSDTESRCIVDFLGELVKTYLDMDAYIDTSYSFTEEFELIDHFNESSQRVKTGLEQEISNNDSEQYIKALTKLTSMCLSTVVFKNTAFKSANKSPVLREFLFFINMFSSDFMFEYEISDSDVPKFGEVFLLLREIPDTTWRGVKPCLPDSKLSFSRSGFYTEEDELSISMYYEEMKSFEASRYYHKGFELFYNNDYEQAIPLLKISIDIEECVRSVRDIAECYARLADVKNAEFYLDKLNKLGESTEDGYRILGRKFYDRGEYEKAITFFDKQLGSKPTEWSYNISDGLHLRGVCKYHMGDKRAALEDLELLTLLSAYEDEALSTKAVIHLELGEHDKAIENMVKSVEIDVSAGKYIKHGHIYRDIGKYEEAISNYEKAIELEDDDYKKSMTYISIASVYKLMNDIDKVAYNLNMALEAEPTNTCVYLDTLELYITENRIEDAITYIQTHESCILAEEDNRLLYLFLYLKILVYSVLEESIDAIIDNMKILSEKDFELKWNYGHTDSWIQSTSLPDNQKDILIKLTRLKS